MLVYEQFWDTFPWQDFFPDISLTANNIPDISLTCFKFPDISRFSRQVVILQRQQHWPLRPSCHPRFWLQASVEAGSTRSRVQWRCLGEHRRHRGLGQPCGQLDTTSGQSLYPHLQTDISGYTVDPCMGRKIADSPFIFWPDPARFSQNFPGPAPF